MLRAWQDSPTRFTEDANSEEDLRLGGYRDRLFVELAQNAADAAASAAEPGTIRVSIVDGELRVANTGASLDAAGVTALASLRASSKRAAQTVGRFGVGFAAVLAVSGEPRIVSRDGGVMFSEQRTKALLADSPELADQLRERSGQVPVLRLVWPVDAGEAPAPDDFQTEVRLPLRAEVDTAALLAEIAEGASDLLIALPWLARIEVESSVWSRREVDGGAIELDAPEGTQRWLLHRCAGTLRAEDVAALGVEAQDRPQWTVCWALPVDPGGAPEPFEQDVLHAPTPTDERVSLPARLIGTLPMEPSRRRVLAGPAGQAVLAAAAHCYLGLVELVAAEHRAALVPAPEFPRSDVDDTLRELVSAELRGSACLVGVDGEAVRPVGAKVLDLPMAGAELTELLAEVLPGLLPASLAAQRWSTRLASVGVTRIGLPAVVEALTGIDRPPQWWYRGYAALAPLADADPDAREELGGLPVPLANGSMRIGPRGALLPGFDAGELLAEVNIPGLALVHSDAVHPVLERLGAVRAGPAELLSSDPLRAALDQADESDDGLAEVVLRLVELAGVRPDECPWLSALPLPDTEGELRRADELMLPSSPLREVLVDDAPLGVLHESWASRWPADVLRAAGVLNSFGVLAEDDPAGPEHDLDGADEWWDSLPEPPSRLVAIRDLDLVDERSWPQALRLLAAEPETLRALREPGGYPGWWLARRALLGGYPPRHWRLPEAGELTGLYDPPPEVGVPAYLYDAIGVRSRLLVSDVDDARDFLARLGQADRQVPASVTLAAHAALAEALEAGTFEAAEVDPPERVRTLAGAVASAEHAVVLDGPWLLGVLPADRVVAAPFGVHGTLAELLDLPFGSDEVDEVDATGGEWLGWSELSAARVACELLDMPVPEDGVWVYENLQVGGVSVPWWLDGDGVPHAADDPAGLARALAWVTDRWSQRHLLVALIAEPEPPTLLG